MAYISVWTLAFASLTFTDALSDNHPGQFVPFWQRACDAGKSFACPYLADVELGLCKQGSAWACNEAGLMHIALSRSGEDLRRVNPAGAAVPFGRGCELSLQAACNNADVLAAGSNRFVTSAPTLYDYPILLRGSKGEIHGTNPSDLYSRACRQGWPGTCRNP